MTSIVLFGSTGSVGVNTLRVVEAFPGRFQVAGLTAWKNHRVLEKQIRKFKPRVVAVADEQVAGQLRRRCRDLSVTIGSGVEGMVQVASMPEAQVAVSAIVGAAGLIPTLAAIHSGKQIALANKETLVMAGELVMREARARGVSIIPVDSEHSAIFQLLHGQRRQDLRRLVLTASGGPLLRLPLGRQARVTPEQALRHPNWKMGPKITIDSATLMNKGLEVIEARWLFDVEPARVDVVIHPQSLVHSLVEYQDGSMLAQLGMPDMRGPIAYALSHPERLALPIPSLDLARAKSLTFEEPNRKQFPCLGYAYDALRAGGTMPAVLNAANEEAVWAFLDRRIPFTSIPRVIRAAMKAHDVKPVYELSDVMAADRWARDRARRAMKITGQDKGVART
ncbi:MAG: 1-deoxy-D-xylulose-5-phosphate reductoisomerase [Nitrospirae bacterium]|nr:1-deoxy-D-xylulose-5-phosphate reductoisomerase [Nitrospirota bacterium]